MIQDSVGWQESYTRTDESRERTKCKIEAYITYKIFLLYQRFPDSKVDMVTLS
jgi:hypothetical protein